MTAEELMKISYYVKEIIKTSFFFITPIILYLMYLKLDEHHKWWKDGDEIDEIGKNQQP